VSCMDGYHTDMIARTGAPDMTSFFFILSFPPLIAWRARSWPAADVES